MGAGGVGQWEWACLANHRPSLICSARKKKERASTVKYRAGYTVFKHLKPHNSKYLKQQKIRGGKFNHQENAFHWVH